MSLREHSRLFEICPLSLSCFTRLEVEGSFPCELKGIKYSTCLKESNVSSICGSYHKNIFFLIGIGFTAED